MWLSRISTNIYIYNYIYIIIYIYNYIYIYIYILIECKCDVHRKGSQLIQNQHENNNARRGQGRETQSFKPLHVRRPLQSQDCVWHVGWWMDMCTYITIHQHTNNANLLGFSCYCLLLYTPQSSTNSRPRRDSAWCPSLRSETSRHPMF
jgi:hypothetical protein